MNRHYISIMRRHGVRAPSTPTLASINVAWGKWEGGSTRIATGTNLAATTGVTVDGVPATGIVATATTVTFITPRATTPIVGIVDIVVTTPAGSATLAASFEYTSVGRAAAVAGALKYAEWDPALGVQLTSGRVNAMEDQGDLVTQLDVAQGTVGYQPLWGATDGANGNPGLTYQRVARTDALRKTTAGGFASGTGMWWGSVHKPTAAAGFSYSLQSIAATGAATEGVTLWCEPTTCALTAFLHDGTSFKAVTGATPLSVGTNYLIEAYITTGGGNKLRVAYNGNQDGEVALDAATCGKALARAAIGSSCIVGASSDAVISHSYIIAANPTTASALVLERYMEEKYGLTVATRTF